jgi:hypothetical protein
MMLATIEFYYGDINMKKTTIFIVLMMLSSLSFSQEEKVYECPSKIHTDQKIISVDKEWSLNNVTYESNFENVFLTTNPKGHASRLTADSEEERQSGGVEIFNLDFYRNNGEKVFIECAYYDTAATYIKELPLEISTCIINFDEKYTSDGQVKCSVAASSKKAVSK